MKIEANSPEEYIEKLPEERKEAMKKLRAVISDNLPEGYREEMSYGMIGFVVPHSLYPAGYHCTPELPLPFMSIASQKNHIAFYHMGLYAEEELMAWFREEYAKFSKYKLDAGKSCLRFKKPDRIPYDLIGELVAKIPAEKWVEIYEDKIKN
jgi:uncharacterized protein YdhG (YjbR/CyaY superfamily)